MIDENTGRRRVLLKLSGEAFGGGQLGVNPDVVGQIAREIAAAVDRVEVSIVVGGGNFFRGAELSQRGMDRGRADYMGMLGTVMNALALQDFLEQAGAATRVQSAISMTQVAEPYIPRRAERHMEKGRVVIFGAGAGLPYFSTDTVAAQRALEIGADEVLVAKNGVDGVYTADPKKDATATKIDRITYQDALQRGLKVVDSTAFSLCMDNGIDMRVFGMEPAGNVTQALLGENDFSAFRTVHCQARHPMRELQSIAVTRQGEQVIVEVQANAFLHHMVRNLVGSLMMVGSGERDAQWLHEVMESKDRTLAGPTAPPNGLSFIGPLYPAQWGLPPDVTWTDQIADGFAFA